LHFGNARDDGLRGWRYGAHANRESGGGREGADGQQFGEPRAKCLPSIAVARPSQYVEIPAMADSRSIPLMADLRALATRGLADSLGIDVLELTADRVVATMPVDQRTRQPFGILHGGASVALAETVASLGATANVDREEFVAVGLEINANHLRAKSEGIITATATPIHLGRTTHVWDIRIVDEDSRPVCVSRCTLAIRPRA